MRLIRVAVAILAALLCSGPLAAQRIAFVGVTLVDVGEGSARPSHTVLVRDGKIELIAPAIITRIPSGYDRIEALRHFLIPGLIELNGVLATSEDDVDADEVLDIYQSRGVTTIRAPLTDRDQEGLRRRSERGDKDHPRVLLGPAPPSGQAMSINELWRSGTQIPSRPPGLSPPETLRALTSDAARELGLADVGVIQVGARADLVLLAADPLASTDALHRIDGVMTLGRWEPVRETTAEWEDRAWDAVDGYYRTLPVAGFARPSCHGESLQECFGGDSRCRGRTANCLNASLPAKRAEVLDELDRYGATAWRSDWIVGQRVSFAMKNGDLERAQAAANACAGSLWWCQALRGYALHRASKGGVAQLDSAMANTNPLVHAELRRPGQRGAVATESVPCVWRNLRALLTPRMFEEYDFEKSTCVEIPFERRFWWLSDPLWSVAGNERKAEHYARWVENRLSEGGPISWGAHNSWDAAIVPPSNRSIRNAPELERDLYVLGGYAFTPDDDRFYEPAASTTEDWELEWDKGRKVRIDSLVQLRANGPIFVHRPDERMITAERWYGIEHQLALLRRGDKLLVMNAGLVPLQIPAASVTSAALAMGRLSDLRIETTAARVDPLGRVRAIAEVSVPPRLEDVTGPSAALVPGRQPLYSDSDLEWMASLEVLAPGLRARAREGAPAPALIDGFGVSDVVLVREDFETARAPLLEAMLTSVELSRSQPFGVYFEVYGVRPDEQLRLAVATAPTNLSLAQRLAGAMRLRPETGLEVNWLEAAETPIPGTMTRFVRLDLANHDEGSFEIVVTVTRADGTVATSNRVVRIGP